MQQNLQGALHVAFMLHTAAEGALISEDSWQQAPQESKADKLLMQQQQQ